ncbi:MAG: type II toxin-antitoxin system VapC family toxin [Acidobacteria bacterium]|nr:type II toxin-antitoxin system VapC family toxin [Acidobacteriota bacterium]
MIGLDTNVLVRYIVQDDPAQAAAVTRLIEDRCTAKSPGYVSVPVLMELVWVLKSAYGHEKATVIPVVRQLLRTAELAVEDRQTVWTALREFEAGTADFADHLIAHRNHARGCTRTYTFDLRAARGSHFALLT